MTSWTTRRVRGAGWRRLRSLQALAGLSICLLLTSPPAAGQDREEVETGSGSPAAAAGKAGGTAVVRVVTEPEYVPIKEKGTGAQREPVREHTHKVAKRTQILVEDGQWVEAGDVLTTGSAFPSDILAAEAGVAFGVEGEIKTVGKTNFNTWIEPLKMIAVDDGIAAFEAPTRFDKLFSGIVAERPVYVEQFRQSIPRYMDRHREKAGITGWAQVNYPYGASSRDALEKLKYDLHYIQHLSLLFDIQIVLQTFRTVLGRQGRR